MSLVKRFGKSSISYSVLQPNMLYFYAYDGFIAYRSYSLLGFGKFYSVLGDPFVESKYLFSILKLFLSKFSNVSFYHIDFLTVEALLRLNFNIACMGTESNICLKNFKFSWKNSPSLKKNVNFAIKSKVSVFEGLLTDLDYSDFNSIIFSWGKLKKTPFFHHSFLCRPLRYLHETGTRVFYAKCNDQTIGFIVCDPIYESGFLIGYGVSQIRFIDSAPKGAVYLTILEALYLFKTEHLRLLSLGLMPFFISFSNFSFRHNNFLEFLFKFFFHFCNWIFSFKGNYRFKNKFHGVHTPYYFASKKKLPFLQLLSAFNLTIQIK